MPSLTPYTAGLLLSVVVSGTVSLLAWQNRPKPMAQTLAVAMAGAVIWSGGILLVPFAGTPGVAIGLFTIALVGMALVVQWCLLVAVEFGGYDQYLTRKTIALTSIQPLLVAVAMVTNERHWLFWTEYRTGDPATLEAARGLTEIGLEQVVVVTGPGFMLHAMYAMVGLAATTVLILQRLNRSALYFRKQGVIILIGLCGPWIAFSLFLAGITAADWTPIGVGLLGTTLFIGIFRYGLTELRPIPGETVVRNIDSGVFILTGDCRINLCNNRARELLGVEPDRQLIGQPVSALLGDHPQLTAVADIDSTNEEVSIEVDGSTRTLSLTISPLAVGRQESADGWTRLFELHDITDQKRQQRDIERQNDRLERFSEIVSHDLRNPLVVANGRLDLLEDDCESEHIEGLREAVKRMEAIIDDTQTMTKQGSTVVERGPISLSAVAEKSWEMADTGQATLEIADDVELSGDSTRIRRLLENLFRNAVDHNETDEQLTVRVGATPDGWYVEDTGSGIPESERESVFEPGESTRPDGTGFGLAIVAEIVDAHDWAITATESAEGGARFEIVPRASDEPVSPTADGDSRRAD